MKSKKKKNRKKIHNTTYNNQNQIRKHKTTERTEQTEAEEET